MPHVAGFKLTYSTLFPYQHPTFSSHTCFHLHAHRNPREDFKTYFVIFSQLSLHKNCGCYIVRTITDTIYKHVQWIRLLKSFKADTPTITSHGWQSVCVSGTLVSPIHTKNHENVMIITVFGDVNRRFGRTIYPNFLGRRDPFSQSTNIKINDVRSFKSAVSICQTSQEESHSSHSPL